MDSRQTVGSDEAARLLGVKKATLYAYVSRGLLRSVRGDDARSRCYLRADVERLVRGSTVGRRPARQSSSPLSWGDPVLESGITLIDSGRFYYRGLDACELASGANVEDVVGLLWRNDVAAGRSLFSGRLEPVPQAWRVALNRLRRAHPSVSMQTILQLAAADDLAGADRRLERAAQCGARLVEACYRYAVRPRSPASGRLSMVLTRAWARRRPELEPVLRAALILCADHELNVSSFTARCVASSGAGPYDVVSGGLAALRGARHGGHSDRVEALFRELGISSQSAPSRQELRSLLRARMQRGEAIPGFGQPLYPDGDPRFDLLLGKLETAASSSPVVVGVRRVAEVGRELLGDHPTVDVGLAAVSTELGRAPGGAFTLFALGRIVGWIAHALEQYESGELIRPRADYVGPAPIEVATEGAG